MEAEAFEKKMEATTSKPRSFEQTKKGKKVLEHKNACSSSWVVDGGCADFAKHGWRSENQQAEEKGEKRTRAAKPIG